MLLYDVIHYTEKRNIRGLLLLVDFEKTFDTVSWSFIKKTLNFLKFGPDTKKSGSTYFTKILNHVLLSMDKSLPGSQ